jgi:hypothetical protein
LYDIEDRADTWSPDARRLLRVAESIPPLKKIQVSLADLARTALLKSSLARAIIYTHDINGRRCVAIPKMVV